MTYGEFISGRSGFEVEGVVVVDLGFPLKIKFGSACLTTRSKLLPKNMLGTYFIL
jgi:hypothetical protein